MESNLAGDSIPGPKWRKVAYGGMQIGYDDNYTDESFLEEMVMNANVVRRDLLKVMKDSVSISQYLCIVALVVLSPLALPRQHLLLHHGTLYLSSDLPDSHAIYQLRFDMGSHCFTPLASSLLA
ncbi:unnamed protein product [Arabidopsis thaliana]|uniref:(thale cress) hypothetical protein n=1 Tax=Arabidopsis thaliana TaxID=3702 RepID=A0A7G2EDU4_ARATH|nr:unnamed protein product [Arabidopsis thaliana]